MRIKYPKEIEETLEACSSYMVYRKGEGMVFKEDAPEELRERYREALERIAEIKKAAL